MDVTPLVEFQDVSVAFAGGVRALDGVSFAVAPREIVGLVGESGSGKTTLCKALLGLVAPSAGEVRLGGAAVGSGQLLALRRRVQMILQEAAASLSPRMRIRALAEEPLRIHGLPMAEGRARLLRLLSLLGLPESTLEKYPHQVSGGQARRIAILRALVLQPELVVADEPTAGLDLSVRGGLLNLLLDLHRDLGLTYLIVSHDLDVVRRVTGRVMVMYLGEIVEDAATEAVFAVPAHPYAAALISTHPVVDPVARRPRIVLRGEVPSPRNPPFGCRFHTRCFQVGERCAGEHPALREVAPGRRVRCHYPLVP